MPPFLREVARGSGRSVPPPGHRAGMCPRLPLCGHEPWGGGSGLGREQAGQLAVVSPKSPSYLLRQPRHLPPPLRDPGVTQGLAFPAPEALASCSCWGPLAARPPACEVLPEDSRGKPLPDACWQVHQGGGLPSGLIRGGLRGQASGHPPAGTGSLVGVCSLGWTEAAGLRTLAVCADTTTSSSSSAL